VRAFHPVLGCFLLATLVTTSSHADEVPFGRFDVPTVFFISKSDDHNRVDYGMRLDERCAPVTDAPLFPYWREFERSPPVRTHPLGMFEGFAYGVAEQRVTDRAADGSTVVVKLKQVGRPISIATHRQPGGPCTAVGTTTIAGIEGAQIVSVYVKLAGFMAVEYVQIFGKNPKTGQTLEERLQNH
jgi:hypothetical protein